MAAHQCSNDHIVAIAIKAAEKCSGALETAAEYAKILFLANAQGVADRYREEPITGADELPGLVIEGEIACRVRAHIRSSVNMLNLTEGFEYQASEWSGWKGSEAETICQQARHNAIQSLPGMSAAPWSI